MKFIFALFFSFLIINAISGQVDHKYIDPEKDFLTAKQFFLQKDYALSYPILNKLRNNIPAVHSAEIFQLQDVNFFYLVTSLLLNKEGVIPEAINFINDKNNFQRSDAMSFYLGHFYFSNHNFEKAISFFEKAGINELDNDQIGGMKYELAYSYFIEKNYDKAKPLFNEIHQLTSNRYYLPANYYFGFIAFKEKDYGAALNSFKVVETLPEYKGLVPYYIAEIYYFQDNKDESLKYVTEALGSPNQYYKTELQLLAAQIYFEEKNYGKALPFFESYIQNSDKISKQIQYEISYCYYMLNNADKAIAGFKQLSTEMDSLGQNSMYLLGDLYLKINEKENARKAFAYSASNSSNLLQEEISKFTYAKLSYELKYNDAALTGIKNFIDKYPKSIYLQEAKEILINLLANSNNFVDALAYYQSISEPSLALQSIYPKLLYGRATELLNEQKIVDAKEMFKKVTDDSHAASIKSFAYFWLAEIAYRDQQYDEAIKLMSLFLQAPGFNGEANPKTANYLIAYSYLEKKQYASALTYFKQVVSKIEYGSSATDQDAYIRTADTYFMLKNYQEAKNMYLNVVRESLPAADYALFQMALIAGINNPGEKIQQLNALSLKYPKSDLNDDVNLEIANTLMADEKFTEAIPYLNKVVSGQSNALKPKALLKIGLSYYDLNDNSNALNIYQKLVMQYPQSVESDLALENIKSIYVQQGQPQQYLDLLKRSGKMISSSAADSITYHAAELQFLRGDCNAAIRSFENYLASNPSGAFVIQANYNKSECYYKLKDWKNAVQGYEFIANTTGNKFIERSLLQAGKLNYLELKDFTKAKNYFLKLKQVSSTPENTLEALRGLVRSYYQAKDFNEASSIAKELLTSKSISTDDRAIANLVLGKSLEVQKKYEEAIIAFREVTAINKSAWAAEAKYEIGACNFNLNNLTFAEREALVVIKENGSSDYWITRSYILLGDIYTIQKDYFNAKASFQGVATNSMIPELKKEAQEKLEKVVAEEKSNSKLIQ